MGVLKRKIQASTLMETLVATVLIVVVFMMSSMVLNSLFASSGFSRNELWVKEELSQLQYLQEHQQLQLPYHRKFGEWRVDVSQNAWQGQQQITFSAVHARTKKELSFTKTYAKN